MSEKIAFEPPEPRYIVEKEVFEMPFNDERLNKPWELRLYAAELVRKKIGDDAQVTSLKVKMPHLVRRVLAKILKQEPLARLYVTIKF